MTLPLPWPDVRKHTPNGQALEPDAVQQNLERIALEWPQSETVWTSWTPVLTGITITSTATGRYVKRGRTVTVYGDFSFTGTVTAGSGPAYVTLPFASADTTYQYGTAQAYDSSGAAHAVGNVELPNDSALLYFRLTTGSAAVSGVTNTAPFAWASGDALSFNVTYEAAA